MQEYVLMTDSDSDLPWQYAREHQIPVVKMPYTLNGQEYLDDNGESGREQDFYKQMRGGATPSTSLLPTQVYLETFEPILKDKDILFLAFSSKMSATYQNVLAARDELKEKYPHRELRVVDTLSISYPQTLLVQRAQQMKAAGAGLNEVADWVEQNRLTAQVWFTVDDLVYLRRGGRVSPTSAVFGTMLNIKPILTMTREGKLEAYTKVQGSKKAMRTLVDKVAEQIVDAENQEVLVLHADAPQQAQELCEMLKQRIIGLWGAKPVLIGPVIGAHAGPGTLAVTFFGKERPV